MSGMRVSRGLVRSCGMRRQLRSTIVEISGAKCIDCRDLGGQVFSRQDSDATSKHDCSDRWMRLSRSLVRSKSKSKRFGRDCRDRWMRTRLRSPRDEISAVESLIENVKMPFGPGLLVYRHILISDGIFAGIHAHFDVVESRWYSCPLSESATVIIWIWSRRFQKLSDTIFF